MTVRELINELKSMPENAQVMPTLSCDETKIYYSIDGVTLHKKKKKTDKFERFMDEMYGNDGTNDVIELNFGMGKNNNFNF